MPAKPPHVSQWIVAGSRVVNRHSRRSTTFRAMFANAPNEQSPDWHSSHGRPTPVSLKTNLPASCTAWPPNTGCRAWSAAITASSSSNFAIFARLRKFVPPSGRAGRHHHHPPRRPGRHPDWLRRSRGVVGGAAVARSALSRARDPGARKSTRRKERNSQEYKSRL